MVHDWGSRDAAFLEINATVLKRLPEIINGGADFVTVPMQGSGTFAVEAMLTTFVPRDGKCLVLINGAYGKRAKRILDIAGRAAAVYETAEDTPPKLAEVEARARRRSRHHPRLRRAVRDHQRRAQPDRCHRRSCAPSTASGCWSMP